MDRCLRLISCVLLINSYDPHCTNGDVTGGCNPVAVFSAEKLRDYNEGPAETEAIANVLLNDARTGKYVIAAEAWDCIWEELIKNGKGLKTVYDRPDGENEHSYNFSGEMLEEMILELNRLITKYSGNGWNTQATANRVVELLGEHRALIQTELDEVNSGVRKLTDKDFLGPKEREHRRRLKTEENSDIGQEDALQKQQEHSKYFDALEQKLIKIERVKMRQVTGKHVEEKAANVSPQSVGQ